MKIWIVWQSIQKLYDFVVGTGKVLHYANPFKNSIKQVEG